MTSTEEVRALVRALGQSTAFDLEQPRYFGAPTYIAHEPGFVYSLHHRHEASPGGGRTSASGFIFMAEHSGTHIDALSHQAWSMELNGGRAVTPELQTYSGFMELGIDEVPPIVRRGVLLDVARLRGVDRLPDNELISRAELQETADSQSVDISSGDIVLIRTGNGGVWGQPDDYGRAPGIDRSAAEWLGSQDVFAVGADNLALDVIGHEDLELGPLPAHTVLIVQNGIFIIENLFLEEVASAQENEFLFVCLPLKMRGVTGSPIRPVAFVPQKMRVP